MISHPAVASNFHACKENPEEDDVIVGDDTDFLKMEPLDKWKSLIWAIPSQEMSLKMEMLRWRRRNSCGILCH